MLRSGDDTPVYGQPVLAPMFDLVTEREVTLPGSPLLCMLLPTGDATEVVVNTAHGMDGYCHAAYHNERGLEGPQVCQVGHECGYDERARRDPECVPSRHAPLEGAC